MTFKLISEVDRSEALWNELLDQNVEALTQIESRGGGLQNSKEVLISVLLPSKEDALRVRSAFLESVKKSSDFMAFVENDVDGSGYHFVFATEAQLDTETLTDMEYLISTCSNAFATESVTWELTRN